MCSRLSAVSTPSRLFVCGAVLSAAGLFAATAGASGLSVARFGGEHGHPTTTNATAIYYNPAGIGESRGLHLFLDASAAWRHARYFRPPDPRDAAEPPGADGANSGEATLFNINFNPMAGATYRITDLSLGLAYYTPFGGQSVWEEREAFESNVIAPGAVDGPQRWYSIAGELRASVLSLAAAYDFGVFDVGISANLMQTVVDTIRAREPGGNNDIRDEGRSRLDASSFDPAIGIGVLYQPIADTLYLGASYQSRPNLGGGVRADGTLTTLFANAVREENDVDFHADWPDVFRIGARYRMREDVELRLFGDYQRWSVVENQCVSEPGADCEVESDGSGAPGSEVVQNQVRDWNDTFGVRAGASYWFDPSVEVYAGAGFGSNAIPDETLEPALLDFHSISASLGGRFELTDGVHLATTYTQVFYVSRDTAGESIHPDLRGPNGVTSASRGPASGGDYSQDLGVLNANLDVAF